MEESVNYYPKSCSWLVGVVAAGALVFCSTGCCQKKVDAEKDKAISAVEAAVVQTRAECDPIKAKLDAAQKEIDTLKATLATVQEENTKLKQTPRFFFDAAVTLMSSSDSDSGDEAAIEAFQQVVDRFPGDSLVQEANKKISELKGRIATRARELAKAQAKVRQLIASCKSNTRSAESAEESGLVFNRYNQLNMNAAIASSRKSEAFREKARAAKEKAEELLKTVPDPDGKLKEQVYRCDWSE